MVARVGIGNQVHVVLTNFASPVIRHKANRNYLIADDKAIPTVKRHATDKRHFPYLKS